jgi:hypothetical protein
LKNQFGNFVIIKREKEKGTVIVEIVTMKLQGREERDDFLKSKELIFVINME